MSCLGNLITYAQPVIEHLHQQVAGSSATVLLADSGGVILRMVGKDDFLGRAALIALAPGAVWSEGGAGGFSCAMASHEDLSVATVGRRRYRQRGQFLTCLAIPILAPSGGILGMLGLLEISSDANSISAHAQALLQAAVEIIENRLIEDVAGGALVLSFHPAVEMLGTPLEGLAVCDTKGRLLHCNRRARRLLGMAFDKEVCGFGAAFDKVFATPWQTLYEHSAHSAVHPIRLSTLCGRVLVATVRPGNRVEAVDKVRAEEDWHDSNALAARRALKAFEVGDGRLVDAARRAQQIAECDIPLLILGENGTGKGAFAQAFHQSGPRREGAFVAIDCASIPVSQLEGELFGYASGIYAGARAQGARGKLREANGGTLFIEHVCDMPLTLQASVLGCAREVRPLAANDGGVECSIDINIVCTSHLPLRQLTALGRFRADLFFGLSGMTVSLPALRERSDFVSLVRQIIDEESHSPGLVLSDKALAILRRHPWPDNLPQLRNALRQAIALAAAQDNCLRVEHLPQEIVNETSGAQTRSAAYLLLRAAETLMLRDVQAAHCGNISAVA